MTRALAAVIALAVCAGNAPEARADDAAKAKRLFVKGNKAFDDGRYSDALGAYRASYELVARPSTLFNIAVCRDRLGELEGAYVDYNTYLGVATDSAADVERADKARARIAELDATLAIEVTISSSPVGAAVFFGEDYNVLGRTPLALSMPIGKATMRLEAPGHLPTSAEVDVRPGTNPALDVVLQPLAKLTITAAPADATIEIAGDIPRSAAGRLDAELEPGTYTVTVSASKHEPRTLEVTVVSGTPASQHVALEKLPEPPPPVDNRRPPPPPPPPPGPGGAPLKYTGIGLGVLGLAAIGFGIERGLTASARSDDAQAAAVGGEFDSALYESAQSAETTMVVMYVLGGACVAAGGVVYVLGLRADKRAEHDRPSIAITPAITRGGAGIGIAGTF